MVITEREKRLVVCDYCLNVAYDHGFAGYEQQAQVMALHGGEVEDHLCDVVELIGEDVDVVCHCACKPERKRGQK